MKRSLYLKSIKGLLALQLAFGPTLATAEDDLLEATQKELNPSGLNILRSIEALNDEMKNTRAARQKAQGVSPEDLQLKNEYQDAMNSQYGYLRDLYYNPRYFHKTMTLGILDATAVLTYLAWVRDTRKRLEPAIQSIDKLKVSLEVPTKDVAVAEEHFKNALLKSWQTMADEEIVSIKAALDPGLRERILGEASLKSAGRLSTSQLRIINEAASVEASFGELVRVTRSWIFTVEQQMSLIDEGTIKKSSLLTPGQKAQIFSLKTSFGQDVARLRELDTALSRTGKLGYYVQTRALKTRFIPGLEELVTNGSGKKIETLNQALKSFLTAEQEAREALIGQWDKLGYEQKAFRPDQASFKLATETLEELNSERAAIAPDKIIKTSSATLEEAFSKLSSAISDLEKACRVDASGASVLPEHGSSSTQALRAQLKSLIEIQKGLPSTEAELATQSMLRQNISALETSLQAMESEVKLKMRVNVPRRNWRSWGPKLGFGVAVLFPIYMYVSERNHVLEVKEHANSALQRSALSKAETGLTGFNLPGLEMQHAALYSAWQHHPLIEQLGIEPPFPAPAAPGLDEPYLILGFMPSLAAATLEVEAEIARDNAGVPQGIAQLPFSQRVYIKVWTQIFLDAREQKEGNAQIKMWKWPNEPGKSEKVAGNIDLEKSDALPKDIDHLIAQLALATAQMPQNLSTLEAQARETLKRAAEENEKKRLEAEEAAAAAAAKEQPAPQVPASDAIMVAPEVPAGEGEEAVPESPQLEAPINTEEQPVDPSAVPPNSGPGAEPPPAETEAPLELGIPGPAPQP